MDTILRNLVDPSMYRRLVYVLLGLPLGTIWFTVLVTLWSLGFGLIVMDRDGRVLGYNRAETELSGLPAGLLRNDG